MLPSEKVNDRVLLVLLAAWNHCLDPTHLLMPTHFKERVWLSLSNTIRKAFPGIRVVCLFVFPSQEDSPASLGGCTLGPIPEPFKELPAGDSAARLALWGAVATFPH